MKVKWILALVLGWGSLAFAQETPPQEPSTAEKGMTNKQAKEICKGKGYDKGAKLFECMNDEKNGKQEKKKDQ